MTASGEEVPSIAQRAAFGAGWVVAWRVVTRNIGLVSTLILVRLLEPGDFGLVALATGFITAVDALSSIGVHDALVRLPSVSKALYDTGFALNVIRGTLTGGLILAIAIPLGHFFDDPRLGVVMLALAGGTFLSAFENIGIIDFRRNLTFRKEFDMQVWSRLLGVTATIFSAAMWHSYWALVAGILVYRATSLVRSYMLSAYRPGFTLRAWRDIVGFSLWTWAQTLIIQFRDRSNSIVIGRIADAGLVGVFAVGLEIALLPITELCEPMARALYSGFAAIQGAARDISSMFVGAVSVGFMLILPAGLGISMVADPLVRLVLGDAWVAAVPVVQILAVGGTTAIFCQSCAVLMNATGRPHVPFYIGCAATLVQVTLLLTLVPVRGVVGAAIAVFSSQATDIFLLLGAAFLLAGIPAARLAIACIRPAAAASIMVLVLQYLGFAWSPSAASDHVGLWLDLGERSAVGAGCYVSALATLWLASGRPPGPEQLVLRLASQLWLGRAATRPMFRRRLNTRLLPERPQQSP